MNETVTFTTIAGMSPSTSKLISRLKSGEQGQTISDDELSIIAGRDTRVKGDGYANLMTAIKHVRRNHALAWERIKGAAAIRCLVCEEAIESGDRRRRLAGRHVKIGIQTLHTIDIAKVKQEDRTLILVRMAQLGAIAMAASSNTTREMEKRSISEPPSRAALIDMFKK